MYAGLLLTQSKDDIDGCTNLHGLLIEHGRFVDPLLYGVESRLAKQRVPADDLKLLNVAVFTDDGREFHGARNARALGNLRVDRLRIADQQGVLHAAADRDD